MKDSAGTIVYVGKAKDLKSRLRQYFGGSDPRAFVQLLSSILGAIEVILTANEKEALILESALIKQHLPRFNVKLRDDKDFLQLRVDLEEPWPWVQLVRRRKNDQARYYGPFHSASACRETLRIINRSFCLRSCRDAVLANRSRPCLQYQIKRCMAPCVLPVERQAYMTQVHDVLLFLDGKRKDLVRTLESRMTDAAEALEFELAARLRDQIAALKSFFQRQQVVLKESVDQDVFAIYREGERVAVQLLFVRQGFLSGSDVYHLRDQSEDNSALLEQVLLQHYEQGHLIPSTIIVDTELENRQTLAELLSERRQGAVQLKRAQRGPSYQLLLNARRNAEQQFRQHRISDAQAEDALHALRTQLALSRLPRHIECIDISNMQGSAQVGSLVVFIDGRASKSRYRTFKLQSSAGQDDFAGIREVVLRRYRNVATDDHSVWLERDEEREANRAAAATQIPDLLVIDGGAAQLGAALEALEELGLGAAFDVIGLAKSRTLDDGFESSEVRHSQERVFLPQAKEALVLAERDPGSFVLQRIRDEAHRVAIGQHRRTRSKESVRTRLDEVPGIGPKKRAALLRHLGSVDAIRRATEEELRKVPGMTPKLVHALLEALGRPPR
jgi:excinuclease ABC subunit C